MTDHSRGPTLRYPTLKHRFRQINVRIHLEMNCSFPRDFSERLYSTSGHVLFNLQDGSFYFFYFSFLFFIFSSFLFCYALSSTSVLCENLDENFSPYNNFTILIMICFCFYTLLRITRSPQHGL